MRRSGNYNHYYCGYNAMAKVTRNYRLRMKYNRWYILIYENLDMSNPPVDIKGPMTYSAAQDMAELLGLHDGDKGEPRK